MSHTHAHPSPKLWVVLALAEEYLPVSRRKRKRRLDEEAELWERVTTVGIVAMFLLKLVTYLAIHELERRVGGVHSVNAAFNKRVHVAETLVDVPRWV